MPPTQQTVCVDFDGVIAEYDGFKGADVFGEPIKGAQEALEMLGSKYNWKIIIFTTRLPSPKFLEYLKKHKIRYDYINENPVQYPNTNNGKPAAHVYIDDRAVTFKGNWMETCEEIRNFTPWYKKN